jgi:hypothetical protein
MKVSQLAGVLQAAASIRADCGGASTSEALRQLSSLCAGHEAKTMSAFVASLAKGLIGGAGADEARYKGEEASNEYVKISEIAQVIDHVCDLSVLVEAKVGAINDLRKFIAFLRDHQDNNVVDFVRRSRDSVSVSKKVRRTVVPKGNGSMPALTVDK